MGSNPTFVTLCEGIVVRERSSAEKGIEAIIAELQVGFKAICEWFTTRAPCDSNIREVLVEYINGPFKKMESCWAFHDEVPDENGSPRSMVDFYIC